MLGASSENAASFAPCSPPTRFDSPLEKYKGQTNDSERTRKGLIELSPGFKLLVLPLHKCLQMLGMVLSLEAVTGNELAQRKF